jgi:hypothetical protein
MKAPEITLTDKDIMALAIVCTYIQDPDSWAGMWPEGMVWEAYRIAEAMIQQRDKDIDEGWEED